MKLKKMVMAGVLALGCVGMLAGCGGGEYLRTDGLPR